MTAIPYGYIRNERGAIDIDADAAAVVQRIFALYLDGHGLPRIAATLNESGTPTPKGKRWQVGTIAYILNNVARYSGWLEHNRARRKRAYIKTRGTWPPLIDDATAERIRAERAQRRSNHRIADTPHLLTGVVWCVGCMRPMRYSTMSLSRGEWVYLRCDGHAGKRLPEHIAIQHISNEMQRLTAVDVDRLLAADNSAGKTQAAIDAARRQLERLTKALQDADDARFIAGTLDDLRYVRTVERIRNEIATTEAELSQLDDKQRREAQQGDKRARLLDVLHNGMDYLRSGNPTQANAWLRAHLRVWAQGREVVLVDWL